MRALIEDGKPGLEEVCERHGVGRLDLFGSAAGESSDPGSSDLDFVVSFVPQDPPRLFDRYFGLKEDLGELFGREVDLVMEGAIENPYFARGVTESRMPLEVERANFQHGEARDVAVCVHLLHDPVVLRLAEVAGLLLEDDLHVVTLPGGERVDLSRLETYGLLIGLSPRNHRRPARAE